MVGWVLHVVTSTQRMSSHVHATHTLRGGISSRVGGLPNVAALARSQMPQTYGDESKAESQQGNVHKKDTFSHLPTAEPGACRVVAVLILGLQFLL